MLVSLTLTSSQHGELMRHLFPDDGCEAVAIALCGRCEGDQRHRLLVQQLVLVPYECCTVRAPDRVTWPTDILVPLIHEADKRRLAIVKIHGHRGYDRFSDVDDMSDKALFPSIHAWIGDGLPHASAVVLDDGRMFGRAVDEAGEFVDLTSINVVGDDLMFWHQAASNHNLPDYGYRISQTFGARTYDSLRKLKIAVVGCSGTGSHVIEQLARNCVGALVLVDPDHIEEKNLNRVLNSGMSDALARASKVSVAKAAVERMGLGTQVLALENNLFTEQAVKAVAECDIVFGCVDTVDARHLLNKLSTFYLLPYFDLGVRIDADGFGGVDQVCGSVHYVQPGGSSLFSRGVYNMEQVRAAGLYRTDPETYRSLLKDGYIKGVREDRPAVVQLNGIIASLAISELLARLHPFRDDPNESFAVHRMSLSHGIYEHEHEGPMCQMLARHAGRGDVQPLLDWAELSSINEAA
ncbi:ThiF family adenylyltransferase [Bradyrhizobium archetypum]|uniref:ThiF family adenylyltransferase n=1 Tax=Bradyrhizobium archetypum TaxID=2721160 RepID=A0A7Y4M0T5_9BRAD|nr:ThiF family adenylyltransferase [Bradyrhizobium archetypum]NOJ46037.1 ThiF family adenylyltransferase [Bradyrhizobium archetypum]